MDFCPRCENVSLAYDSEKKEACCFNPTCRFLEAVRTTEEYYERYAPAEKNLLEKLSLGH